MNAIRHTILGFFFFLALTVLGIVTIALGDWHPFNKPQMLDVFFPDASNLRIGDPVMIHGLQRGRVKDLVFTQGISDPGRRVMATLSLEEPIELKTDYEIMIGSQSLLGGKEIDLLAGEGTRLPDSEYSHLRGRSEPNLMRALSKIVGDNGDDFHSIVTNIKDASASVKSITSKLDQGEGSFGKAINKPELHDSIVSFFERGRDLIKQAQEGNGALHALLYDDETGARLKSGVAGFAAAGERIGRGEGLLGRITSSDSDATWNDFKAFASDVRALGANVRAGQGVVGRLFNDPQLEADFVAIGQKLRGATDDIAVLVDSARRGRGVIGWLFSDDEARRTLDRLVDQLSRAVEDAREAAPVSSFASFLFGNY